jgi:Flp pilus assembly protein protease CpaA
MVMVELGFEQGIIVGIMATILGLLIIIGMLTYREKELKARNEYMALLNDKEYRAYNEYLKKFN